MQRCVPLFLAIVSLLFAGIACGGPSPSLNSSATTQQPVEKHLSAFRPIQGTDYMIADISGNPGDERADASPFSWVERGYSGYSGYEIYNYVFFSEAKRKHLIDCCRATKMLYFKSSVFPPVPPQTSLKILNLYSGGCLSGQNQIRIKMVS